MDPVKLAPLGAPIGFLVFNCLLLDFTNKLHPSYSDQRRLNFGIFYTIIAVLSSLFLAGSMFANDIDRPPTLVMALACLVIVHSVSLASYFLQGEKAWNEKSPHDWRRLLALASSTWDLCAVS